jgi:hypothetical protein
MKIACYSDIHGRLPKVVPCDLAIIAGDIGPDTGLPKEIGFLQGHFLPWLRNFPLAVFIAGNHDRIFEQAPHLIPRDWEAFGGNVPRSPKEIGGPMEGRYAYLEDSRCGVYCEKLNQGLSVWGSPWTLPYGRYCFMTSESGIADRLSVVPEGIDILVSHGPPYGYGDPGRPDCEDCPPINAGSLALLDTIHRVKPRLIVCGHLHGGRGIYQIGPTTVINASCTSDDKSKMIVNGPIITDLD